MNWTVFDVTSLIIGNIYQMIGEDQCIIYEENVMPKYRIDSVRVDRQGRCLVAQKGDMFTFLGCNTLGHIQLLIGTEVFTLYPSCKRDILFLQDMTTEVFNQYESVIRVSL